MFAKSSANVTTSEVKPSLYGEAGHTLIAYIVIVCPSVRLGLTMVKFSYWLMRHR